MAVFYPDDKFTLQITSTGKHLDGELTAKESMDNAFKLDAAGISVDVFVVGNKRESVAGCCEGEFYVYQPHDDEGCSLPIPPWPATPDGCDE